MSAWPSEWLTADWKSWDAIATLDISTGQAALAGGVLEDGTSLIALNFGRGTWFARQLPEQAVEEKRVGSPPFPKDLEQIEKLWDLAVNVGGTEDPVATAQEATAPADTGDQQRGGSRRGDLNGWTCEACGYTTYGIHVADGVTPMFLACRKSGTPGGEGCGGQAVSLMYPPPPYPAHVLDETEWEWYRPGERELRQLGAGERDHVERGGLLLRPLTDEGRAVLEGHRS